MEVVLLILLVLSLLLNTFQFFWIRTLKNVLVFIGMKKKDIGNALSKYIEVLISFEKKDVYSADPTYRKLIYDSYKLNEYLNGCFQKVFEAVDLDILDGDSQDDK